ncbi:D12 class N6 adenine-specific DNA methyltransferase [Desulfurispirillum indicum S5]|uniref:site-specific DNA-methyltransferase (adenine-specific) n=1 Tax=Desulfurispirillum indicum (strain ATCC BAA-1389 / DSM 22839 / S5) TaxID=653733 RepID=E6W453_DESIS|nr:DNA adenine methylase [Desulfurispirillum indicum]ADU67017.1 D12 class N6 adenine-specific DNA methyltransferase [Desulfurispirillum indicum S5]
MSNESTRVTQSGRYSPLRYPGGKGKVARFMCEVIRLNGLSDGLYVEPYAGGAAVAWELLITGVVRRVAINDVSRPVYAFWMSVLHRTEELCKAIDSIPLTVDEWDRQREIFLDHTGADEFKLGLAFFFLNRTNRSGILNAGVIGGRNQTGKWKIDARFNKGDLISRIKKIAALRSRVELTGMDAQEFFAEKAGNWNPNTLVYIDPPYYEKGRYLYYDAYAPEDHKSIAESVFRLTHVSWVVSYDDVRPIHDLYSDTSWLQYTLNYSARNASRGKEAMFFSDGLKVPSLPLPLLETARCINAKPLSGGNRVVV